MSTEVQSYYRRWQTLEERKTEVADDLKELFAEAKSNGFDTKALREAFRRAEVDADQQASRERDEHEALVETYHAALARDARVHAREEAA